MARRGRACGGRVWRRAAASSDPSCRGSTRSCSRSLPAIRFSSPPTVSGKVSQKGCPPRRRRNSSPIRSSLGTRSEEHTSELQSQSNLVCRLLLEKKNTTIRSRIERMLPEQNQIALHAVEMGQRGHVVLLYYSTTALRRSQLLPTLEPSTVITHFP